MSDDLQLSCRHSFFDLDKYRACERCQVQARCRGDKGFASRCISKQLQSLQSLQSLESVESLEPLEPLELVYCKNPWRFYQTLQVILLYCIQSIVSDPKLLMSVEMPSKNRGCKCMQNKKPIICQERSTLSTHCRLWKIHNRSIFTKNSYLPALSWLHCASCQDIFCVFWFTGKRFSIPGAKPGSGTLRLRTIAFLCGALIRQNEKFAIRNWWFFSQWEMLENAIPMTSHNVQ